MKDLRRDFPHTFTEYFKSGGGGGGIPASLLDETMLAPCGTFRHSTGTTTGPAAPVFLLQANLIPGGLLLVINGLHSCMDMAGQTQIIRLLAKACRGEPFSTEELATGNMPRRDILLPLLHYPDEELLKRPPGDGRPREPITGRDSGRSSRRRTTTDPASSSSITLVHLHLFRPSTTNPQSRRLGHDALGRRRTRRTNPLHIDRRRPKRPPLAVHHAIPPPAPITIIPSSESSSTTTLTRTVDARRYVAGLPPTYPGDAAFKVSSTSRVASLLSKPPGAVAAELRARLGPDEVHDGIRAHVAKLARSRAGSSGSSGGGGLDPSMGVNLSSWAKESCYDFDFGGGLGRPAVVQRPVFIDDSWESLVYLMPRRPDGEIAVLVCLREEDMERMREDNEMARYGRWIG
ncbi:hypothetical protein PG994_006320 [Apiospora phragmitis]|uniref:Trichothecene 3-O-acetyltransferase-like N-terminal domain-containing protein n=1 Tax=Apiospora phragmitis TaxID=2905665 RepID=A0ABR1VEQ3_9PEZI